MQRWPAIERVLEMARRGSSVFESYDVVSVSSISMSSIRTVLRSQKRRLKSEKYFLA